MALMLREENFVVIDVGAYQIKAGMGMHDTNKPPSVIISMAEFNHPIQNNNIVSWQDLEASWHHVLFKELALKKHRNESPVLLTVPVQWTKEEHERITQIFFENFNVPGIYIAPQPLLALYGCGSVSGIIIDIGHTTTDVNVVVDSIVQPQSSFSIPVGGQHFDKYLLQLFQNDVALVETFRQHDIPLDEGFATFVREQPGVCNVLVGHDVRESMLAAEVPTALDAAPTAAVEEFTDGDTAKDENDTSQVPEIVEVEYKGHKFSLGSYRHRAFDPLFAVNLLNSDTLSLSEALRLAVMNCEPPEIRPRLWENIVLTGGCSQTTHLQDNAGDSQPRLINFLRIPDYFTVLKEKPYQRYSTWLGAEIVAKLVFIDAKNYVSKVDYNESGPAVVHRKSY
ncbi:hypothetical protein DFQ28_008218 [Apophysomyces sp. BC1034]|nr:hypothetical protein DFQ29_007406 [Apophysomyces sp. BC1021]KAG0186178.1 hypothetical protein DFQ28_008218 [Apophysomyces sp. BC1034]